MVPLRLSARTLAREIRVPSNRITAILSGDRGVTAETAILLGERFGTSAEFWLNLQTAHDLEEARRHMRRAAWVKRRTRRGLSSVTSKRLGDGGLY